MGVRSRVSPLAVVAVFIVLVVIAGVDSVSTSPKTHLARTATSIPERMPPNPPRVANIPPESCINHDLEATVMDTGIDSMQEDQDIVTVISSVPCRLDGYPNVALSNAQTKTTVIDGGEFGRSKPPMPVAVGPGEPASFVIQEPQNVSGCPAAKLDIGVPGAEPQVVVTVASVIGDGSWPTCESLTVSAFEQGNDPGQYMG
jgi:hypothetical protein